MHALQRLGATPLPVLDQVAEQLRSPADAALEKRKPQFREAPGDAPQENRLGGGMAGSGEMADMIVGEIGRRQPQALVTTGTVEGRRDAQLDAFRPDRIIIIFAVEA